MNIKPIRNDADLRAALARLDKLWGAARDTPEGDELDVLVCWWKVRGRALPHWPIDPVEAIKFRMEQQGLTPRDLEPFIGSSGRVSEVLNRQRRLSLGMVKRLLEGLNIPYESLMAGV